MGSGQTEGDELKMSGRSVPAFPSEVEGRMR